MDFSKVLLIVLVFFLWENSFAKGVLTYQHYQRLNNPNNTNTTDNWFSFEYVKQKNHKKKRFESIYNVGLRYYPENKGILFSIQEAFLKYERSKTTVKYGRSILDWDKFEKFWGLSKFQGIRGFSLLEDNQEGLIGVHLERKFKT
jgi:hypothetical protein